MLFLKGRLYQLFIVAQQDTPQLSGSPRQLRTVDVTAQFFAGRGLYMAFHPWAASPYGPVSVQSQ